MRRKGLGVLAAFGMLFALLLTWTTPAYAVGEVAQVGDTQYMTLDEAIEEAPEGSTIVLLQDCTLETGFNKTLTFTGNGRITVDKQLTSNGEGWMCFGLYDPSRVLTLDGPNVSIEWTSDGSAPWLMLSLSGTINVTNGAHWTFKFDSRTTGTRNALYMNAGSELNVSNGSTFEILGVGTEGNAGQGIQLDATGAANINVTGGSTFLIDGTNRGYVNSPSIYVEDSTFTVQNCTSNGSNGGTFTAINSQVKYENNAGHGLSAGNVTIQNSTVDCLDNGLFGFTYSGNMTVDSTSTINANGNAFKGSGGGIRASSSSGTTTVEAGATINILNNGHNGLENYGSFTMEDGVKFVATGNQERTTNGGGIYNGGTLVLPSNAVITGNYAKQTGGGICNDGTVIIPDGVTGIQLYNNHADDAGDDINNRGDARIEGLFQTGDWTLDGVGLGGVADDCTDPITGWYDDAASTRWEAHADTYAGVHAEEYAFEGEATTVTGPLALKAAHGLGSVAVDPADITVYMGGDQGYEGVITDEDDGSYDASNSLPEPGFYFVLPDEINQAFADADIAEVGEAADLSSYMTIYTNGYGGSTGELHWKLVKYGATNSSAYGQFIYRIVPVPAPGQEAVPVRLQFTSEDGTTFTNDTFDPAQAGALHQQYTMQLYTELVDANQVVFEVDIKGTKYYNSMELQEGVLDIRYVTGNQDDVVTDVVNSNEELAAARAQNPDKAYAVMPDSTVYYINESQVDVTDSAAPSLLFDDLADSDDTGVAADHPQQLANRALDVITETGASFEHPWYQAKYLDLVDANNGNVYLTANHPVTVYWPYPAGTDQNTEFHLVHFADLDRDMNNGELSGQIESSSAAYVEVENTEHGIRFTTDGFSPFVLMWEGEGDGPAEPPVNAEPPASGTLTATGDNSLTAITVLGAAGGTCIAAAYVLRKRKAQ
ncbi:right-handed parallel beta-helix repeat-containing protein [Enorma phocaeensis]|uniref:right-handed parallel beta-helix repeat-containing protein n=1 Tax=Enorma phocaeensis TaxID=1871019 RepID=UPI001FE71660|nr:right-handed parallel beta-helix repeat-containing protein [Enorma phocaeensis]